MKNNKKSILNGTVTSIDKIFTVISLLCRSSTLISFDKKKKKKEKKLDQISYIILIQRKRFFQSFLIRENVAGRNDSVIFVDRNLTKNFFFESLKYSNIAVKKDQTIIKRS